MLTEHQLCTAFMEWCRWQANSEPLFKYVYHITNEGKRSYRTGKALVAAGLCKGIPDYCIPLRTHDKAGLYIEFKTESGVLSVHQKEWITRLRDVGHTVVVARCLSDAQYITQEHIAKAKHYLASTNENRQLHGLLGLPDNTAPGSAMPRGIPVPGTTGKSGKRKSPFDEGFRKEPKPRSPVRKRQRKAS